MNFAMINPKRMLKSRFGKAGLVLYVLWEVMTFIVVGPSAIAAGNEIGQRAALAILQSLS